ncbi:hypothetical protein [Streptomyces avidinii]|uniref:SnoaL-like protein n=1 Tax=Streptomyces avidinii TaxID=1895 RepID=A0ABS4KWL8_STRAV|nr:hypothetical protein [Streptomyces avidinii]MBP2034425.1 hypothetical protein [Streptomyces avidinii]GGY86184.1 hypothetical protein GCM10010343_08870 [Streptomyces avidinii]
MDDIAAEIDDYLDRYAGTLTSYDAQAAAALWGSPGMILNDEQGAGVLESREAMARGLEQSYPLYRRLGLASVGFERLSHERLSATIYLVRVRWLFYDQEGNRMTDSLASYILRRGDGGLRAFVCVPADDVEKLQALAAEKGVSLSPRQGHQ